MAYTAYMSITGQKQGAINGPVTDTGKQNTILVHAFSVEIVSPRDPASGLATGQRQHEPVSILKEVDKTSPQLWNALVNNETLTTCLLQFWTTGTAGVQQQAYTITLTNASIASITQSMLDNDAAANTTFPLEEEISLTYQKIEWTWVEGGITATDSWTTTT